jgi:hypothetical protein
VGYTKGTDGSRGVGERPFFLFFLLEVKFKGYYYWAAAGPRLQELKFYRPHFTHPGRPGYCTEEITLILHLSLSLSDCRQPFPSTMRIVTPGLFHWNTGAEKSYDSHYDGAITNLWDACAPIRPLISVCAGWLGCMVGCMSTGECIVFYSVWPADRYSAVQRSKAASHVYVCSGGHIPR